jgi:hypothetical protein
VRRRSASWRETSSRQFQPSAAVLRTWPVPDTKTTFVDTKKHKRSTFSCFSCAVTTAFVSRASDADRRSRRRGDDGRRSPWQSCPYQSRRDRRATFMPRRRRVVSSGEAARQMHRGSWSRVSAKYIYANICATRKCHQFAVSPHKLLAAPKL